MLSADKQNTVFFSVPYALTSQHRMIQRSQAGREGTADVINMPRSAQWCLHLIGYSEMKG